MLTPLALMLIATLTTADNVDNAEPETFVEIQFRLLETDAAGETIARLAQPHIMTIVNKTFWISLPHKLLVHEKFGGEPVNEGLELIGIVRPSADGQYQLQATLTRGHAVKDDIDLTIVHRDEVEIRMTLTKEELTPQPQGEPKPRKFKLSPHRLLEITVQRPKT
ncbi:hypothetical protein C5Y93_17750 [Blastopirellula marina]|uniref:Uncharacterized protein n=1 Tax=Blastopirellula marina TaxID=124 RepID=A0A2S8GJJ0_9BACT|nr:hypothetical protein C5Y93_17750 [Blastopirellula marina]